MEVINIKQGLGGGAETQQSALCDLAPVPLSPMIQTTKCCRLDGAEYIRIIMARNNNLSAFRADTIKRTLTDILWS